MIDAQDVQEFRHLFSGGIDHRIPLFNGKGRFEFLVCRCAEVK
jgi:hypothetical protein